MTFPFELMLPHVAAADPGANRGSKYDDHHIFGVKKWSAAAGRNHSAS
jgi:hypothetical protein